MYCYTINFLYISELYAMEDNEYLIFVFETFFSQIILILGCFKMLSVLKTTGHQKIGWLIKWKGSGSDGGLIKVLSQCYNGGTEKTMKNFSQASQCPD